MRTKLMIAVASLSIVAAGCERKTSQIPHDVEPSSAGRTHVGGGPTDNSSSGASGTTNIGGESSDIANPSTAHGGTAESLSGGGAQTKAGVTGKSMIEPKSSTTPPPGMTHPVETAPSETTVP